MMGSNKRAQVTETIHRAVQQAGGLVAVALAVAAAALIVSLAALAVALRTRPRAA